MMVVRAAALVGSLVVGTFASAASAEEVLTPAEVRVQGCLMAAAEAHQIPPALILILLKVEGGRLGAVSGNTNATVDIGPMQVNTIWVPQIARHWRTSNEAAFLALRDNFCANLEGGSWILRQALDEARGDFWSGVGIYHSHNPVHKDAYLRKVLEWTLRLRDQSQRTAKPATTEQQRVSPSNTPSR